MFAVLHLQWVIFVGMISSAEFSSVNHIIHLMSKEKEGRHSHLRMPTFFW